jgi:hypothetical protein
MVEVIGAVAAAGVLMVIMASGERQVEMRVVVTMLVVEWAVAAAGVLMVIMASGERQVEMRVVVGGKWG